VNQDKKKEIVSVKLVGPDGSEREVDPAATYLVVTHDYIINVGGRYSFLKELSPQFVGITLRDSVIDYVKAASAGGRAVRATLDGRYVSENPANEEAEKPQ
jgi:2',3'-cyclic-nucleotide 2'-phosphodiesterase (5'-nucleotidase family)